ncbi:hypothetical protein Taro_026540 [Colocasia esculenta]|uniref:Uncharacterized protein n=1 Tax=Colocasia esculenta TaxID=4460 RepID=A0A843VFG8_COLES|nr:hypothetical protein [Colocasia esculenta]
MEPFHRLRGISPNRWKAPSVGGGIPQQMGVFHRELGYQIGIYGKSEKEVNVILRRMAAVRPDEARIMYERLQSHPSIKVSKKAKQFMFGFQAMEMMKVSSYSISKATGYEDFFNAFVEDNVKYAAPRAAEQDEGALLQALPYLTLLFSPKDELVRAWTGGIAGASSSQHAPSTDLERRLEEALRREVKVSLAQLRVEMKVEVALAREQCALEQAEEACLQKQ